MKKFITLLFCLGLFFTGMFAQTDFRSGYIITNDNDTVYGDIDYRGGSFMGRRCVFRGSDGAIHKYTPFDIAAYRFVDSKYYVSKTVDDGRQLFLELLVQGKLCVYFLKDMDGEHYFMEKEDVALKEVPFTEESIQIDGREYTRSNSHYGVLNYYTQDVPKLQSEIKRMKELTPTNMIVLAQKYHDMVCDDYSCVVYEKIPPRVKVDLEVAGGAFGFLRSEMTSNEAGRWGEQLGVYAHVWLPRENEKLFFRTGVVGTLFGGDKSDEKEMEYSVKIPLHFEYQYPKGIVRPRLAYGINYYFPNMLTVSGMAGVNFQFSKYIGLSVNYEMEVLPFFVFFPSFHPFGHNIYGGLYIQF